MLTSSHNRSVFLGTLLKKSQLAFETIFEDFPIYTMLMMKPSSNVVSIFQFDRRFCANISLV